MKIKLIQFGDQDILIEISNGWSENYTAHLLPIVLHIFLLEKQVLAKVFKTQDKSRKDSYFWKDSWILRVSCDAMGYWHQSVLVGENSVLEAPRKLLQGRKWCKHKCCTVSVPGVSQGVQTLSSSFSIQQRRSSSLFRIHIARKGKWVRFSTHTVQRHMRSIGADWSETGYIHRASSQRPHRSCLLSSFSASLSPESTCSNHFMSVSLPHWSQWREQMWCTNLQGFAVPGSRTDSVSTDERSGITCKPGHRYSPAITAAAFPLFRDGSYKGSLRDP